MAHTSRRAPQAETTEAEVPQAEGDEEADSSDEALPRTEDMQEVVCGYAYTYMYMIVHITYIYIYNIYVSLA